MDDETCLWSFFGAKSREKWDLAGVKWPGGRERAGRACVRWKVDEKWCRPGTERLWLSN